MVDLYILDTDTLSLLEGGSARVTARIASADPLGIALTVISIVEQMEGRLARINAAKSREQALLAYGQLTDTTNALRQLRVVTFSEAAILRYELLFRMKLNVGKNDLRIAAIALEIDATVVTRNTRDFSRVPGLAIEDWSA